MKKSDSNKARSLQLIKWVAFIGIVLLSGAKVDAKSATLVEGETAKYAIALASDATKAEKTAAKELADYLKKISGADFLIKNETELKEGTPAILVGNGEQAKKLLPEIPWDKLRDDEIVVKTVGDKLILAGQRPRGTLYAVYSFLENALGVRWWTPDAETVPSLKTIEIPAQDTVYAPPFFYRQVYASTMEWNGPYFPTRSKNNGESQKQTADFGGYHSSLGAPHTWFQILPPAKYFAAHPEWYTDRTRGGLPCMAGSTPPTDTTSQLCLSNEEMKKEFIRKTLMWLSHHPDGEVLNVSQMDNVDRCQCDACLAIEAETDSPAGPVIRFTNDVADAVGKEYPNVKIKTLAYLYSVKPPTNTKVRDNVIVQICAATDSFDSSRAMDSETNAEFRDIMVGWSKIAPQIAVWDYVTSFRFDIYPFPNLRTLGANARFFANHNAVSYFSQNDIWTNGAAYFVTLKTWVISQLMWNPNQDSEKLINEFLEGYYGKAGPFLRQYIDLMENAFAKSGDRLEWFPNRSKFLTLEVMNRATELMADANKAVADDAALLHRLRLVQMPLDMAWIVNYKTLRAEADKTGIAFKGPTNITEFIAALGNDIKAYEVNNYGERAPIGPLIRGLQTWFGTPAAVSEEIKALFPPQTNLNGAIVTSVDDWFLGNWGRQLTEKRVDPATGKEVGYMFPGHMDWALGYPYGEYASLASNVKNSWYHVYIYARVVAEENAPSEKTAMITGVYRKKDTPTTPGEQDAEKEMDARAHEARKTYREIAGPDYKLIDLGVFPTAAGNSIYVAPYLDPANKGVYVERIILVPEKAPLAAQ